MQTIDLAANLTENLRAASQPPRPLPPFSGDEAECLMCGNVGATTQYRGFGDCTHEAETVYGYGTNQRLHRECGRCGYAWDEAVVS